MTTELHLGIYRRSLIRNGFVPKFHHTSMQGLEGAMASHDILL